eukprot:TRINITY_DN10752_c0_g2_i1.p1 TRINITY_DN10752_c0_g2~~TRINITY_DN10752_c0_g2_i1.p1  ORF type:complete len:603 (-),score=132.13 TRINITY_DN10752_c0_g2_i1:239-2047(-)
MVAAKDVWSVLVALSAWLSCVTAVNFVHVGNLTMDDVDGAFAANVGSSEHAYVVEDALRHMYAALPKNGDGLLSVASARHALNRYFVQQHGWYIGGLDLLQPVVSVARAQSAVANGWVASYLLEKLESASGGKGLDLNDLTRFVALFKHLVRREVDARLAKMYEELDLPASSPSDLEPKIVDELLLFYEMVFTFAGKINIENKEFSTAKRLFRKMYDDETATTAWFQELAKRHFDRTGERGSIKRETMAQIAVAFGEEYTDLNQQECHSLKHALIDFGRRSIKAGRVRLPDFYNSSFHTHWQFTEKSEYLRDLGVLDESSKGKPPHVIIPNYVSARSNCLRASQLYSICCRNECEDLMTYLEQQIASPAASPERIVELVSSFGTDTVKAPRTLSQTLKKRLDDIANNNFGMVNLHGRLFAQWVHHAFPNECSYPHEKSKISPNFPDEWRQTNGHASHMTSEDERRSYVDEDTCTANPSEEEVTPCDVDPDADPDAEVDLPWTEVEDAFAEPTHHAPSSPMWRLAALAAAALGVLTYRQAKSLNRKVQVSMFVFVLITLFCASLLSTSVFLFLGTGSSLVFAMHSLEMRAQMGFKVSAYADHV